MSGTSHMTGSPSAAYRTPGTDLPSYERARPPVRSYRQGWTWQLVYLHTRVRQAAFPTSDVGLPLNARYKEVAVAMTVPKHVQRLDRVVIRFAGDSGDGMQLTGDRFTSETAQLGNDISTLPNFPAEIRAPAGTLPGVSSFQ